MTPLRERRAGRRAAIALAVVALGAGALWWAWSGGAAGLAGLRWPGSAAEIPSFEAEGIESSTARLLTRARERVVAEPGLAEAWLEYGMVLEAARLPELAAPTYREAVRLDPTDRRARYYLAIVLNDLGQRAEAIALFEALIEEDRYYPPYFVRLGDAQTANGQGQEAMVSYGKATELDDSYALAHRQLGQARLAAGDVDGAIESLERAIALRDEDRRTYTALAQAYQQKGDTARASELARVAEGLGESLSMRDSLRLPVQRLRPEVRLARVEAELAWRQRQYEDAIEPLLRVLSAWPEDPSLHELLSRAYAETGQTERAEFYRERAAALRRSQGTPAP